MESGTFALLNSRFTSPSLYSQLLRIGLDAGLTIDDAEDQRGCAYQRAVDVLADFNPSDGCDEMDRWLRQIMRNMCASHKATTVRRESKCAEIDWIQTTNERHNRQSHVLRGEMLHRLSFSGFSSVQCRIIRMGLDSWTEREISKYLRIPKTTVHNRLKSGLRVLAEMPPELTPAELDSFCLSGFVSISEYQFNQLSKVPIYHRPTGLWDRTKLSFSKRRNSP